MNEMIFEFNKSLPKELTNTTIDKAKQNNKHESINKLNKIFKFTQKIVNWAEFGK
jgi:hypothetical protein